MEFVQAVVVICIFFVQACIVIVIFGDVLGPHAASLGAAVMPVLLNLTHCGNTTMQVSDVCFCLEFVLAYWFCFLLVLLVVVFSRASRTCHFLLFFLNFFNFYFLLVVELTLQLELIAACCMCPGFGSVTQRTALTLRQRPSRVRRCSQKPVLCFWRTLPKYATAMPSFAVFWTCAQDLSD